MPLRASLVAAALAVGACSGDVQDPTGPVPAGALVFASIDAGYFHTCALTPAGDAWCWGSNLAGLLGDGSGRSSARPVRVASDVGFRSLDAGGGHTCAVAADGTAWCWGHNDEGQLGDGTFVDRPRPVRVTGVPRLVSVSAGHAHSCGIDVDGHAWCWGDDSRGQLGIGMKGDRSASPVLVEPELTFVQVRAGYYATCALSSGGATWCWGLNGEGQAGDGSMTDRTSPVRVVDAPGFQSIEGGDRFSCALETSGRPWCWGLAPLPDGTQAQGLSRPAPIPTLPKLSILAGAMGASTVSDAGRFACGLAGVRLLCWGPLVDRFGGEGDRPVEPGPGRSWIAVTAGAAPACALSDDGRAWCAGANFAGQLGDGTEQDRATFTPVGAPDGND